MADCKIWLKFGTESDHITPDPKNFQGQGVKGQGHILPPFYWQLSIYVTWTIVLFVIIPCKLQWRFKIIQENNQIILILIN